MNFTDMWGTYCDCDYENGWIPNSDYTGCVLYTHDCPNWDEEFNGTMCFCP
jgi:hypothetical protein